MTRRLRKIALWLLLLFAVIFVLAWLVLASPLFAEIRRTLVETVLSEQIGQPLVVTDDVRINPGPIARVIVSGVQIPSENLEKTVLAELGRLELEVNLIDLYRGQINIDNLVLDRLQVNLITNLDGSTSWTKEVFREEPDPSEAAAAPEVNPGLLTFLSRKTAKFSNIGLKIDNENSGFDFDFDLTDLTLSQDHEQNTVRIDSHGTVNKQSFTIEGEYPRGQPNKTTASFGPMTVTFDAQALPDRPGFGGVLSVDTGEIGELFDILRLERVVEGTGHMEVELVRESTSLAIDAFEARIKLEDGTLLEAAGSAADLLTVDGLDLKFNGRFHPEGDPPPKAEKLADLRLVAIDAHLVGEDGLIEFENLQITSNSIDPGFEEIGPIRIGRIFRTEHDTLALADIVAQAGPVDAPYAKIEGRVDDVFRFNGFEFSGSLFAPASLVMREFESDTVNAFGQVRADFAVNDASGEIALEQLTARTEGTTLWEMTATGKTENFKRFDGLVVDVNIRVPDKAAFLEALDLKPGRALPLELSISTLTVEKEVQLDTGLVAGESGLDLNLDVGFVEKKPVVRGGLYSDELVFRDVDEVIESILAFKALGKAEADAPKEKLEEELQDADESKPSDLLDLKRILSELDLEFLIDLKKITGPAGTSSLSSAITSKDGQAHFGPLDFAYGKGFVKLEADVNALEEPLMLAAKGETGGWNFGKILDEVGLGIQAHGTVRGNFDLTGQLGSVQDYVNSLSGNATLAIYGGGISTSLLELAGLGVVPWLFSKEIQDGYAPIVCAVAPVGIKNGAAYSKSMVVETKSVQIVAAGSLNWRGDAISLRAEPRPVGRPMARSPFPFEVTGRLSKPDFKLEVGEPSFKGLFIPNLKESERVPCRPDIRQQPAKKKEQQPKKKRKKLLPF